MKKAEWIWHNGDYEIMQLNRCLTSRYEREVFIPPFWKMDYYCKNVKFVKTFTLAREENLYIRTSGRFNIIADIVGEEKHEYVRHYNGILTLLPGTYKLTVSVYCEHTLPALFIDGETVKSDGSFFSTCNDFNQTPVGHDGLYDKDAAPGDFNFTYETVSYEVLEKTENALLIDCKKEMMGRFRLSGNGSGTVEVVYGESVAEARDRSAAELSDRLEFPAQTSAPVSKAFRYIQFICDGPVHIDMPLIEREYLPQLRRSTFKSSNPLLDEIYRVSLDTLQLNTREFFIDGIKRDRWVWGGDAYQSYLMNYYSFFDLKTTRRTITALAGKKPIATYINHVMEYSFYWVIALYDFYRYTGDLAFIERMFPTAVEFVDMTLERKQENGLIQGKPDDWVFIDWANLDNRGQISPVQLIFLKTLDVMTALCVILKKDASLYRQAYVELKKSLFELLWDEDHGVFRYSIVNGLANNEVKKHPHIFALFYDLLDASQRQRVVDSVMLNDNVEKITTPYMRFYELSALLMADKHDFVLDEILDYWGGMLNADATSFWETYDKLLPGDAQYAMYGRPYGKSFCHAWGASPLYLIGRYFAGLEPASDGYCAFRITPVLSRLDWFETELPLLNGSLTLYIDRNSVRVTTDGTPGELCLRKDLFVPVDKPDADNEECWIFTIGANECRSISLQGKRRG